MSEQESTHQKLMNEAYALWQKNEKWSKEEFLDNLDPIHKFAVTAGNLNYQVENGGFSQWHCNGYGTTEVVDYLRRTLFDLA